MAIDRNKLKGRRATGPVSFSLIDMIQALRGFRSPDGYVVIPNEIADKIENEIERLYAVEETAVALAHDIVTGPRATPSREHPLILAILGPLEENSHEE